VGIEAGWGDRASERAADWSPQLSREREL